MNLSARFLATLLLLATPVASPQIRVQVTLVNVLASVLDSSGKPVIDLLRDAFEISEENVPQKIERFEAVTARPLDLALLVDTSLSEVHELKFEGEAAARFIHQVVRPEDALAVFEFDETVTQLSEFTNSTATLEAAARRLQTGSGTSLYDALMFGARALRARPADRRRVLVLVTDAGETTSGTSFEQARKTSVVSEALLYTIVIRPVKTESGRNTAGEHAIRTITDDTGGAMYFLDDVKQLDDTFARINRELRTQYLLGYYPNPRPPAGVYRNLSLRVKGTAGYTLEYRKSYYTGAAQ